ncbi:MAG: carB [Oscillospiraceae bacterium]|jgi:carbamoyl-phosphate synthase large subunit|nr:carB [Oscillospiraceae bacterium]
MDLVFTKMHGCGNDYIYFNCFEQQISNPEELSIVLSDRHFSIGGDGIVLICPSDVADAKMRMFNMDGSEGKMCGNAVRCVGKYLYDNGMVNSSNITIETLSGVKNLEMFIKDFKAVSAKVNMGKAELEPKKIPVNFDGENVISRPVKIGDKEHEITCVSMGNPHCVMFCEDVDGIEIEKVGPVFENFELFPERINTEFIKVIDHKTLQMRVWERGSGETLACGTGACAAAVAACCNGLCEKGEDITVKLKGGDLVINYTDEAVFMTGEAVKAFEGVVAI